MPNDQHLSIEQAYGLIPNQQPASPDEYAATRAAQRKTRRMTHAYRAIIERLLREGLSENEAANWIANAERLEAATRAEEVYERALREQAAEEEARAIGAQPWLASAVMRAKQTGGTAGQCLTGGKEVKASPLELKMDEGTARFSGLASPFLGEPDAVGDIIQPGAYRDTLAEAEARGNRYILPVLWQHDQAQPLGGILTAVERPDGLHVEGQLAVDTELGKYAASLLSKRMISGLSIGFIARKSHYQGTTRVLTDIQLLEISLVTLPAAPLARIDSVGR